MCTRAPVPPGGGEQPRDGGVLGRRGTRGEVVRVRRPAAAGRGREHAGVLGVHDQQRAEPAVSASIASQLGRVQQRELAAPRSRRGST